MHINEILQRKNITRQKKIKKIIYFCVIFFYGVIFSINYFVHNWKQITNNMYKVGLGLVCP